MNTNIKWAIVMALIFFSGTKAFSQNKQPEEIKTLVIVDGQQNLWTQDEINTSINYSRVKSINYLSDSLSRIKKYGEKAKYGVLIVTYKNSPKKTINKTQYQKNSSGLTKIEFEKLNYDFKNITVNDTVVFIFKFKNIGNTALTINKLRSSCGCTIPNWSKKQINPEHTGAITVKYYSSNSKKFTENILVYYNGKDSPVRLSISGVVINR